ncbi:hypothetical protein BVY00_00255 [bacterium G20]|nr:hypothetical protein BVY00_00255 [bacterium G20]
MLKLSKVMANPSELATLAKYACSGQMPPHGNLEEADRVLGFSFGYRLARGGGWEPGATNYDLAELIAGNEILRSLPMTLEEEVAAALIHLEPKLTDQIDVIKTRSAKQKVSGTHEVMVLAKPRIEESGARKLAVVAFRYHLPRAEAIVREAGFSTVVPDMRNFGDFDPESEQWWTTSRQRWIGYELGVIAYFAARGYL